MGYQSVKWEKFPAFVVYANDRETFQTKTHQTLRQASIYATGHNPYEPPPVQTRQTLRHAQGYALLRGESYAVWPGSQETSWELLRMHQPQFRRYLDEIIRGGPSCELIDEMNERCSKVQIYCDWIAEAQPHPWLRYPEPRYYERPHAAAQDPLILFYLELRQLLRLRGVSRLKKCGACPQYFVQATTHATRFCSQPCRAKANPTRKENNAKYQRTHREAQHRTQNTADLRRIDTAKQEYRLTEGRDPAVSDILEKLDMSRRRWNTLCRWEEQTYGHRRVTTLC